MRRDSHLVPPALATETDRWRLSLCAISVKVDYMLLVARAYRIEGSRISFGPTETRTPGSPPSPVCDIGVSPGVHDVFRALDGAVSVVRTENNGVLISGPDHSVILFSQ